MRYSTIVEKDDKTLLEIIDALNQFEKDRFIAGIQARHYTKFQIEQTLDMVNSYQSRMNIEARSLVKFSEDFIQQFATDNNKCFETAERYFNRIRSTLSALKKVFQKTCPRSMVQLPEGVTLEVVEPIGGLRALLDAKLLRVVTMHLLENALHHTSEGTITLTYYMKEEGFYLEVKDTGSGLPEKLKENIFALLSDKNTYLQDETPGLGLSICKAIIDRTGGKIGARDNVEAGHGTIVWLWTPTRILN